MNTREAVLTGIAEAKRVHTDLNIEAAVTGGAGFVDVFGTITKFGVPLLFRPLAGLLGFCLSLPAPGIVVSTKRPLSVQRFTGAHELGHAVMHHESSLDGEEILTGENLKQLQEIQANAFASEFLVPRWLLKHHGIQQKWNRESLTDPITVYQLSLRLGVSYEATCVSLKLHKLIDPSLFTRLNAVPRKQIKQKLLAGLQLDHWRRDVWLLTKHDEGSVLQGQPDDLFLFRLDEKSGAGYLWELYDLEQKGFAVIRDQRDLGSGMAVGESVQREVTAQSEKATEGEILLEQRRPWQRLGVPCDQLHLRYDLQGKEEGIPRALRHDLEVA